MRPGGASYQTLRQSFASFLLIIAYRHVPAAVAAPFDYTSLIWASLFGWMLWNENPEPMVWTGALIIALSGIYIARREALHRKSGSGD